MKIMHILCTDRLSGAENVAIDILSCFRDDNEVYYVSPDGEIRDCVTSRGINFIPCNTDSISELKRVYSEIKPDIVHAHDPRMSFKCALAGFPFVSQLHCNCGWLKKLCPNSIALLYTLIKAKAVITVSPSIKEEYIFSFAMGKRHRMIYNTVDAEKVKELSLKECGGQYDLVFVGRLIEEKRPLMFLDVVKNVKKKIPSLRSVMVGDGELAEKVEEKIASDNIGDVTLCGFDSNPYRYINNSKICVMTSSMEGFGLVAIESMILSKPVIATPVGGLANLVDSSCGALCETSEEMTDAVISLLTDGEKYRKTSEGALEKSKKFTDTESYKSKILEVYKSILQ